MSRRSKRTMARLWRGACFGVVRASKQSRAHEVGRGTVGVGRDMRVEIQDEPPSRVAETIFKLCGPEVDASPATHAVAAEWRRQWKVSPPRSALVTAGVHTRERKSE